LFEFFFGDKLRQEFALVLIGDSFLFRIRRFQETICYEEVSVFELVDAESRSQHRGLVTQLHCVEDGLLVVLDFPSRASD